MFIDGRWLVFVVGVLVFYRLHLAEPAFRRWNDRIMVVACVGCLAYVQYTPDNLSVAAEIRIGVLFGGLMLVLARYDALLAASRWTQPLMWCGAMCYSLYLVHWPVVKLLSKALYVAGVRGIWPTLGVAVPLCLLAALAVAWIFYRLVERRFVANRSGLPLIGEVGESGHKLTS